MAHSVATSLDITAAVSVSTSDDDPPASATVAAVASTKTNMADSSVVITARKFSKSLVLTKIDMVVLQELISGGADVCADRKDDCLRLLCKLKDAISLTRGHNKRARTLARLNLNLNKSISADQQYRSLPGKGGVGSKSTDLVLNIGKSRPPQQQQKGFASDNSNSNGDETTVETTTTTVMTDTPVVVDESVVLTAITVPASSKKNAEMITKQIRLPAKFRVVIYPGLRLV